MCVHMCMQVCVWRSEVNMNVFVSCSPHYFFRQEPAPEEDMELSALAKLTG